MKKRLFFVSNSSSSSFVVIDRSGKFDDKYKGIYKGVPVVIDGKDAYTTEFGWGPETIQDVWSHIAFAYLQALELDEKTTNSVKFIVDEKTYLQMLEAVIREYTEASSVGWQILDGYIDHQSSASEGQNVEIFDDSETLKMFLFGKDSKIKLDNDNH